MGYGYGYGGPCLPRDNRALGVAASEAGMELPLSAATDLSNLLHTEFQSNQFIKSANKKTPFIFEDLAYKAHSNIIEESQKLAVAVRIAKGGYAVTLKDSQEVLSQIKEIHGSLFSYITVS